LQALIEAKAPLDTVDKDGWSALMLAAFNGHEACLQALIKAKAPLDTMSNDGWSALKLAASKGHEACLQALIEAKAPLDTVDKGGWSALMLAASKGHEACLQALIKAKAPLDTVDKDGWSALTLAIRFSQATTMKLLALIEVERNKLSSGFMPSLTRSFFLAENRGSIEGKVVVASEPLPLEHWKPLYFGNWDMLNNKEIEVLTSKVHEIGFGFLFCGLNIQHVRKTVLTFYKNCSLYELFFLLEDPIGIISYCSISFLFGDGKLILISGCASELHAANDAFHLSLNEKNVVDYLLFFNASLNADGEVLKAAHFPNDSSDIDKDYCEYIENINTSDSGRSHLVKGIIMTHEHKFLLLDYRVESNGMVEIHSEPEVIEGTCSVFEVIEFGVRYTKHRDLNKGS
jgi:hypothetical protein